MCKASREEMLTEAISRLEYYNLDSLIITRYKQGTLAKTSNNSNVSYLTEEEQKVVRDFENETGALVYYVISNDVPNLGLMYSLFFVSPYKDDWEDQWEYMRESTPLVYVVNATQYAFSDYGTIGIECHDGVLIRTA